ncbi:hypothetical protein LZ30DRAFT_735894 [Colletotrichum cereale]|nr:hypothetical protein LZ30DRAFT_735894 [Colletotrichum cereale]
MLITMSLFFTGRGEHMPTWDSPASLLGRKLRYCKHPLGRGIESQSGTEHEAVTMEATPTILLKPAADVHPRRKVAETELRPHSQPSSTETGMSILLDSGAGPNMKYMDAITVLHLLTEMALNIAIQKLLHRRADVLAHSGKY